MDVKVVYADQNGTLSVVPDETAGASTGWRPSSLPFAVAYLTLSSAAIASNAMVLTGIVAADRLRSPYAVLASALCLQCGMDAAVGHYATIGWLLAGGGNAAAPCRGVATITAAMSTVELVTFAALACLNAYVRPDYDRLPPSAAAALWAAPSVYTYVILTPTLLFSTRHFPSRGRCGFIANTTGWFYPTLLTVFGFMIPWSMSFYFVFVSRPTMTTRTPKSANILPTLAWSKIQIDLIVPKLIFTSYTTLVMPSFISSSVYLYGNPNDNPWAENEVPEDALDGYLSKLPIIFDVFVPLVLIYYHKVFRKKCRELYLHGFRNSVSDGRQISTTLKRFGKTECLTDDAPVLFLEESGLISVRLPSEGGFLIKVCDLNRSDNNVNDGKKVVRFSRRGNRFSDESGVFYGTTNGSKDEESCL